MLGEVEETIYVVDEDEGDEEVRVSRSSPASSKALLTESLQTISRKSEMLFVRGTSPTFGL